MKLYYPARKVYRTTQTFRQHQINYPQNYPGIDWAFPNGTKVLAQEHGKVIFARKGYNQGFGNLMKVRYGNMVIWLGHLKSIKAKVGQKVKPGDVLGRSGNTGNSTGPHLHLGVYRGGWIDPNKVMYRPYKTPPKPNGGNGGNEVPDGIKGVDLSHWNKAVNIQDLADWGAKFAWIKLTQGTDFYDNQAARFYNQCLDTGILPSFYHFYEPGPSMSKQVEWFIKCLDNNPVYLPVALDFEDDGNQLDKYSKKHHTRYVYQFAKSLQFYSGYPEITIYSRKNLWERHIKTGAYPWYKLLQWKANSQNMAPWTDYTVWQYGQKKFDGVLIDTNVWNPKVPFPPEKPGAPPPVVKVAHSVITFTDGSQVKMIPE